MNDFNKEHLAVKAYRLAEMTDRDWKRVMPIYHQEAKQWDRFTNIFSCLLILSGAIALYLDWLPPWFRIFGAVAIIMAVQSFANHQGRKEGFQIGYEWGKEDGVCKAMGIKEEEKGEMFQQARKVIVEFKVESGNPDLELGKKWRDGPEDSKS